MTEPAQQPLFDTEEPAVPPKKAAKPRASRAKAKPAAEQDGEKPTAAKAPAKPRASRKKKVADAAPADAAAETAKSAKAAVPAGEKGIAPAAETPVPRVESPVPSAEGKAQIASPARAETRAAGSGDPGYSGHASGVNAPGNSGHVEEWRPSAKSVPEPVPEPPARVTEPVAEPLAAASAPVAEPPSAAPAPRQYPVYVPRHVAKQMEQEGKEAPLAVTASQAAEMQIPVAEPSAPRPQREPREPRDDQQRGDRHDRRGRNDRHDRGQRGDRPERFESEERTDMGITDPLSPDEELGSGEGIVEISGKGFGFIRDAKRGFSQHPSDIFVTPELVRRYHLRDGQWLKGETRKSNRGSQLHRILEINGDEPEKARNLPAFDELTVISPLERIRLETVPERYTTRIIDLMTPIGKGQRGLIVAPPRTGKTTLLQHMAAAVAKNHPELKLIILLVDERPEEVTDFKRTCPHAEIMASSNDMDVKSHTRIATLCMERAKRLVEAGKDVFILLDSITRVGRAFNNAATGGRTMSGGLDTRALEIPRKIFAAARNTEEAGSLTIMATALIETNSRMDDVIFQEFKGTGNMELVLDRRISEQRIYPAVDIFLSGTRREELLVPADDLHKIHVVRRGLSGYKPMEAIERLIFFAKKFPTNEQMLREIPG